jgi:RNA polymerase sigma factor (sigma-70 family)
MDPDLGTRQNFPPTRHSVLEALRSPSAETRERAFETLAAAYWRPIYFYLRLKWGASAEDAKDLTQDFFFRAFEREDFRQYDPARAKFRTYLRACVDRAAMNRHKAEGRLKRGGGAQMLSLDFEAADREFGSGLAGAEDVEAAFHREFVRSLFGMAVEALRQHSRVHGKEAHFALFERYDLEGPDAPERVSYRALAEEFDLPVTQVTNYLAWARREFRRLALEALRSMTGSEAEFREEARALFGVDPE